MELDVRGRLHSGPPDRTRPLPMVGDGSRSEQRVGSEPRNRDEQRVEIGAAPPAAAAPGDADGPVFVDASGRRSKKFRRAGWVITLACAGYAMTVIGTLLGGNSSAPWLPIPGLAEEKGRSETVEIQPTPTVGASLSGAPGAPDASPSATDPAAGGEIARESTGGVTPGPDRQPDPGAGGPTAPDAPPPGEGEEKPGSDTSPPPGGDPDTGPGGTGDGDPSPPPSPSNSPDPGESGDPVQTSPPQLNNQALAAEGAQ
ncbi:hypothetical protein [Streptomyces sp. NRRL F-5135]|uniref:hypothetical protein n=1 Tax=Streptomyces sp. NRRL F-5135 TaxID=1463858 RepID=UPI00068A7FA2|nr:hypothetical protein [Streptomyces sp. NRRL F-5135]